MNYSESYIRTDLASEATVQNLSSINGITWYESGSDVKVQSMNIETPEAAEKIGKPIGTYITIGFGKLWLCSDELTEQVSDTIAEELWKLINGSVPKLSSVLIAGLGNRDITADSIGPQCVDNILVTRHIKANDENLFMKMNWLDVSAISPGVVGQTGIETTELIRGAINNVSPDLLIVADALASRSVERLAATVQLTDTGISPGSGIGNRRKAINKEELGVPVIAIGVPTVVDSSTLVYDALEKAGIENINDELTEVLENGKSFFVSLKESDIAVHELSGVIAKALNKCFNG